MGTGTQIELHYTILLFIIFPWRHPSSLVQNIFLTSDISDFLLLNFLNHWEAVKIIVHYITKHYITYRIAVIWQPPIQTVLLFMVGSWLERFSSQQTLRHHLTVLCHLFQVSVAWSSLQGQEYQLEWTDEGPNCFSNSFTTLEHWEFCSMATYHCTFI